MTDSYRGVYAVMYGDIFCIAGVKSKLRAYGRDQTAVNVRLCVRFTYHNSTTEVVRKLEMWANVQRDGRPAEYRWRPLSNAAKFG